MNYEGALAVDVITLFACGALLWRYARLSHAHPATIYFLFHIFVVTMRLAGLIGGALTLFSYDSDGARWPIYISSVTEAEIVRAVLVADFVLGLMTAGWIWAAREKGTAPHPTRMPPRFTPLRPILIWIVVTFTLPIGVLSMALFTILPGRGEGMDLGEWNSSSYPLIVQSWAGLALLALVYLYGFRLSLLIPTGLYLSIMVYQGFHRFRVIIPVILMIQIFLSRSGRTWPTRKMVTILVVSALVFFPLKKIGRAAQQGQSLEEIAKTSQQEITQASSGGSGDQMLLDEFAAALALVDEGGRYYYGQPYVALLSLPIPRQLWPEKPSVADYQRDMSRRWRPMHQAGMVVTFMGELYAQLGLASLITGSFFLAYVLGRLYHSSSRRPYYSVERFCYLLVACNLIQVYRDGLVSLFIFVVVNMSPLFLVAIMHLIGAIRLPLSAATAGPSTAIAGPPPS